MKKIVAIIEKGDGDGYGIYAAKGEPLFANGLTEQEARDEFLALVPEQAEYIKIILQSFTISEFFCLL